MVSLGKTKVAEAFTDEAASFAAKRLAASLATAGPTVPLGAAAIKDLTILAGNKIKNGAIKFAEFSNQMIKDLGGKTKPYLEKLYREQMIELGLGKEIDELGITASKIKPPLEGKTNFQVHDPKKVGRTVVDIDRFEGNILWEEKSATSGINKITGADETSKWVSKHITKKFGDLVESRKYLPDFYKNAEIGFDFVKPGAEANFKLAVEAEIQRLAKLHPDITIKVNWR